MPQNSAVTYLLLQILVKFTKCHCGMTLAISWTYGCHSPPWNQWNKFWFMWISLLPSFFLHKGPTSHITSLSCFQENQLYATTDQEVIQFFVKRCNDYSKCTSCSLDPHCGWSITLKKCLQGDKDQPEWVPCLCVSPIHCLCCHAFHVPSTGHWSRKWLVSTA